MKNEEEGESLPVRLEQELWKVEVGVSYNEGFVYVINWEKLEEVDLRNQVSRISSRWID